MPFDGSRVPDQGLDRDRPRRTHPGHESPSRQGPIPYQPGDSQADTGFEQAIEPWRSHHDSPFAIPPGPSRLRDLDWPAQLTAPEELCHVAVVAAGLFALVAAAGGMVLAWA